MLKNIISFEYNFNDNNGTCSKMQCNKKENYKESAVLKSKKA